MGSNDILNLQSATWGPIYGPIYTMIPTFISIFGIGYALAGGMDLMAIVRVSFAFFFTGSSVIVLFMSAMENYAREKWNIKTCETFYFTASLLALWGECFLFTHWCPHVLVWFSPPSCRSRVLGH